MELKHIPLGQLHVSPVNMRHGKKAPEIADILPSVRERGILQPLLVRPNAEGFEIVAGRRRYYAARAVEAEKGAFDPVPCAVMAETDDAAALEASLIENAARLDPSPMKQYETFMRLIAGGRTPEQIAATFGLTRRGVEQRLALANLHPHLRELYGSEEVDDETIEYLAMATRTQQKAWLALHDKGDAPHGSYVKHWLMGGQAVDIKAALFPVETYGGELKKDLFGEETYFADTEAFWTLQRQAIAFRRDAYLANGWQEVVVLPDGETFQQWQHERLAKAKGGKVFVTVSPRGPVEFFEGWTSRASLAKAKKAADKDKAEIKPADRPAMTQAMENYLELHRHIVVREHLLANPGAALRLLIAHACAASGNWTVRREAQRSASNAIKASVEASPAQKAFENRRKAIEKLIGVSEKFDDDSRTAAVFLRLMTMKAAQLEEIAAFVIADTLAVGSVAAEAAGHTLKAKADGIWSPDAAFFDLIREKPTLNAMIEEVAGRDVARANAGEKTATQKRIILDALQGRNGRKKVSGWLPRWMAFPFEGYGKGRSALGETAADARKLAKP